MKPKFMGILVACVVCVGPAFGQAAGSSSLPVGSVWTYDNIYKMTIESAVPEFRASYTQKSYSGQWSYCSEPLKLDMRGNRVR